MINHIIKELSAHRLENNEDAQSVSPTEVNSESDEEIMDSSDFESTEDDDDDNVENCVWNGRYKCTAIKCQKMFNRRIDLKNHMTVHKSSKRTT